GPIADAVGPATALVEGQVPPHPVGDALGEVGEDAAQPFRLGGALADVAGGAVAGRVVTDVLVLGAAEFLGEQEGQGIAGGAGEWASREVDDLATFQTRLQGLRFHSPPLRAVSGNAVPPLGPNGGGYAV